MENSISNFELSDSMINPDSKASSLSEKSDNFEEIEDVSLVSSERKDDFDNNLPDTVSLLIHPVDGTKVYLVGTAHFSEESKNDVARVIRAVQPHVVMLELCQSRSQILTMDEKAILEEAKNINFESIRYTIRRDGLYYGVTYLLLLNLSAYLTREIGMAPGGEFRVALHEATNVPGCQVQLGDRPIRITILRALAQLSWFQLIKLGCQLLFSKEHISKEDVEKCKERDILEQLLMDMSDEYPTVARVLIEERDIFLTHSIQLASRGRPPVASSGEQDPLRVVAVVGIGHSLGIKKLYFQDQSPFIDEIVKIPPPSLSSRILKITVKVTFLSLGGYLIYKCIPIPQTFKSTVSTTLQSMIERIK